MNGRILTERLLATTSLAALILAGASHEASATTTCTVVAGGSFTNSSSIPCVEVTGNSAGITNTSTGKIGPGPGGPAVFVDNGVTLSGGIANSGTISGGKGIDGSAAGIEIEGVVNGGITNSGSISVNTTGDAFNYGAIAVGTFFGGTTSSFAGGITNSGMLSINAVNAGFDNAVVSVNTSTFTGNIVNIGTIAGLVNGTDVGIYGITVSASIFNGGIINAGMISVGAIATSTEETAQAIGISAGFGIFAGGIFNSGQILVAANAKGASCACANAIGVALSGGSFGSNVPGGGIVNTGTISVSATATNGGCCNTALAVGIGSTRLGEITVSLFNGGITNTGTIIATARAIGTSDAIFATAAGIAFGASTFNGGILNSGLISATAFAQGGSDHTEAFAVGVAVRDSTFNGGFSNTGSIVASATAVAAAGNDAFENHADAVGVSLSGSVFNGGFNNGGFISASALASNAGGEAYGVELFASTFTGGITNSGTILANGSMTGSSPDAFMNVIGVTFGGANLSGGFLNSGMIAASAAGNDFIGGVPCAEALGVGIDINTFSGGFNNSGGIIASAVSTHDASADGVEIFAQTFSGGIANSGLISATALGGDFGCAVGLTVRATNFSGTLVNSGTIMARASGAHSASAIGLELLTFTGSVINTGTIMALATSTNEAVPYGAAIAVFRGHPTINNSGTIVGSAVGIDLRNDSGASTVNLTGGLIAGGTFNGCCGGAIMLSANADTVNISGGRIVGDIVGQGAANIINVTMGSGNVFTMAGAIINVGTVNLKSGTFLSDDLTAVGGSTIGTVNFNQSPNTTLALEVDPNLTAARLAATGTITLTGGPAIEAFEGPFNWVPGTTYNLGDVITGSSIVGTYANVLSNSPFFTPVLTQGATADSLSLTMLSPGQVPGLNGNQQSVANAIIDIPGGNATLDQIFELNSTQLGPTLTQLSGSQYSQTNYQPLIEAWQNFSDSLSDRLGAGAGYGGTTTASYSPGEGLQFAQGDVPQQVAQASDGGHGMAALPQQWGAWMRGYGLTSSAPSTATSAPYRESGAGLVGGVDKQMSDQLVVGVAVNVSTDKANVSGGGSSLVDAYQGAVYGQYALDPNWYVNGIAGFGWQTYKTARFVNFMGAGTDHGSFDGQSGKLYGETGYTLRPAFLTGNDLRVVPYVGLGYLHMHTDSFTESGPTALSVQSMDPNSLTTTLGARASVMWQVGSTVFRPELRAAWQHEWLDAAATVRATFAAAPGGPGFTATGTAFSRESFLGGAGLTTNITSSIQAFVDGDVKLNGGYSAETVSGGLRVAF